MRTESKYKWSIAIAAVLAIGLVAQGVLLWQTRQQVAALDPGYEQAAQEREDEELSDIEQRLLSRLDEQEARRQQSVADPWNGGFFGGDPFAEFERMRQRMNQTMNAFMGGSAIAGSSLASPSMSFGFSSPEIELKETQEDYRLLIRVPEEHEIALQTDVDDRRVTLSGKISASADRGGNGFTGQFVSSSQFTRRFDLPGEVDDLKMYTEQSEQGMVIVLPKQESSAGEQASKVS